MSMPQSYEPYYKLTHYMLGENTRKKLLDIANAPGAFVDISYKISFFKLPSTIQHFNTTGLNCVCQMLRVTESGSKIHKDKNKTKIEVLLFICIYIAIYERFFLLFLELTEIF